MSSNQAGPIGAVELEAAAAALNEASFVEAANGDDDDGRSGDQGSGAGGVQVQGAHRALHEMVARGGSFSGRERNCAYLNTRDGQFAAAASAVGFDFPDDARAVVTLDYDGDGDLDVITTNRTAPRLRVLLNRSERLVGSDRTHSIGLVLESSAPGNRSAIGATVEVSLKNAPPIVRTVTAGAGFLGASSTRLTIGVGGASAVDDVRVTWPGGVAESFGPLPANGEAFTLKQGAAGSTPRERITTGFTVASPLSSTETAFEGPGCDAAVVSAYLTLPEPLPPIERNGEPYAWRDIDIEPHALHEPGSGPRVVTLWSLDCALCATELTRWKTSDATYPILALSVDDVIGAARGQKFDHARLDDFVTAWPDTGEREITFGTASYELLEALQSAVDRPFARDEDIALPATFVLDAAGRIASVHRGPVGAEVLGTELAFLSSPESEQPEKRRSRATPFQGRWLAAAPKFSAVGLARAWLDSGQARAAADLLQRAEARGEWSSDSATARPASRASAEAARLLYEAGDLPHAIEAANLTSKLRPEWAKGHFNRATILDAAGLFEEAEAAYTQVLELRARHWQALANRGWLRGRTGRKAEGLADLQQALKVLPKGVPQGQRAQLESMVQALREGRE
ncbi:ASPIC and UnbV [Planctomycetes bacterium Poly30]|uniref:ASPIC and UnbV n=1 Tax=Saltatorellus ferox TaxID=2528018 RepID=A0A518EVS6_9BACT|nr:ASPIC and UnbV [Planctomycetes bacterium Poly30]